MHAPSEHALVGERVRKGSKIREFWMALCEHVGGGLLRGRRTDEERLNPSSIFPPISFYILSIAAAAWRFLPHGINLLLDVRASVLRPSVRVCQPTPTPTATSPSDMCAHEKQLRFAKPKDGKAQERREWGLGRPGPPAMPVPPPISSPIPPLIPSCLDALRARQSGKCYD